MKAELQWYIASLPYPFDLGNTGYMNLDAYKTAVQTTKAEGTSMIPWRNRKLDYPPQEDYYHKAKVHQ